MQAINVDELKTNFSEILKRVQDGEKIAFLFGKRKKSGTIKVRVLH